MPAYLDILSEKLKLSDDLLSSYDKVIREKIRGAAADLLRETSDIFAINQCLHLASSIVLRNTAELDKALDAIRSLGLPGNTDPATIVTIITLYHVLEREAARSPDADARERVDRIRDRFRVMNWMIGPESMKVLGIPG